MIEVINIINTLTHFFSETFLNPQKRVFVGYLFSAFIFAALWLIVVNKKSLKYSLKTIFAKKIWFSSSAKSDYILLVLNKILMPFISPYLIGQVLIATFWFESLHQWFIPESAIDWPKWLIMTLFTLNLFLLDDISKYLVHRWMHKSPILWQFHRVHHSATVLTPLTIFRTHPVEGVLFTLRSAVVQGVSIAVFAFFFGSQVDLISVVGINVFLFLFNLLGANLRHSSVAIHYPRCIERWFMSPAQHQLHHSTDPRHFDQNFGVILTVWDRIGNSFQYSAVNTELEFGIKEKGVLTEQTVLQLYLSPFFGAFKIIQTRLKKLLAKDSILTKDLTQTNSSRASENNGAAKLKDV